MNRFKVALLNFVLRHIWNGLTEDDILSIRTQSTPKGEKMIEIYMGLNRIPDDEAKQFGTDARLITKLPVYKKVLSHARADLKDRLVNKSKIVDDMVFCKAGLYTLDVVENTFKKMADL